MGGHERNTTQPSACSEAPNQPTSSDQTQSATPATMSTRQVLFAALVAMLAVAPTFGEVALDPEAAALAIAADKHAATLALPTATETGESKALLFGPKGDMDINKAPLVTMSDAPCKQICKNVCKMDLTKSCSTVPVVSKVCTPTKKTLSKQVCSKKCTLTAETLKSDKHPSGPVSDTFSNPNPSTPLDSASAASAGRRLSGLIAADVAAKTVVAGKMIKSLPMPTCDDVCETVSFEVPDMECHEVTQQTEVCKMVPSNDCHQECVCIPQKTLAVKLPKKTLDIGASKP